MEALKQTVENLIDSSQYDEACRLVAKTFSLEFKTEFLENNYHFSRDKDKRDIYNITLKRGSRNYTFKFGQSIGKSGFYAKQGSRITQIDSKFLDLKNTDLYYRVRQISGIPFNSNCDKIFKPTAPTLYDVLACLQKYEVGTFQNFCDDFGYDSDSRTALKTYKAVVKEYDRMCSLFTDEELEVLQVVS